MNNLNTKNYGEPFLDNKELSFIKIVGEMRPGMKLVVLDVDKTVYDRVPTNKVFGRRPYLWSFLSEIYKQYDIALWSDTNAASLEVKLKKLNIMKETDFKVAFYLNNQAVKEVFNTSGKKIRIKPLSVIWKAFPQYNQHNTIICEDNEAYFFDNPKNGLLVKPYYFPNYYTDDELLLLKKYLIYLSAVDSFAEVDHTNWKDLISKL